MIKKALEYINGLKQPFITTINGETYSDKELERVSFNPKASTICMNTLSSLVDYIKSCADPMSLPMLIHVQSPTKVQMYSSLDRERKRETLVEVNASVPSFSFDHYIGHEAFCVGVQSKFINSDDRALILQFAGTVESGTVASYGDDGISQKATVKTGISTKEDCIVPNPATLRPYRTFVEVQQPASQFVFRMKQDKYDGIQCALFEADGGAWKNVAMESIKNYLKEELKDIGEFIVIS